MRLDILDVDKFVEVNNCPEVTNPIYFDSSGHPTPDGLLSYELFGIAGSYDRKTIYGYIDLKKHFFHPVVYKLLIRLDRRISDIVNGSKYYRVDSTGELIEDNENGETGISFLYKNWDKIKFKETDSRIRHDRLRLLNNLKKNEIFITKYPVIPAFYRDVNYSASGRRDSVHVLNEYYVKILTAVSALDTSSGFDFMGAVTESRVQNALVEIYDKLTEELAHKNGIIRKFLMGKSVDYAVRSVISAPRINSNRWNEQKIPFAYTGVPLAQLCVLFFPFFVREIHVFLSEEFESHGYIPITDDKTGKKIKAIYLKNPMEDYTLDKIKGLINLFISSPEDRFNVLEVNTEEGYFPCTIFYNDLQRPFTLTDLLFISAKKIVEDKHVYVTRYPIEHHQNIYPSKIKVLSTHKTKKQKIGNKWFEDYPEVYPDYPIEGDPFIGTVLLSNAMLPALGGDYDGDMITVRGVFSQEANAEAERLIYSPKNILDSNGQNARTKQKESILGLYQLTID